MGIEVNSVNVVCSRCGISYGRRKGYFSVNYAILYKGIGYLTVCKDCVDKIYASYLSQCDDAKQAVRQVCRKLDLYWNDKIYDSVEKKNTKHTSMTGYIAKINTSSFIGKSYDDTLIEEGGLWNFKPQESPSGDVGSAGEFEVTEKIMKYWGYGHQKERYEWLEGRREEWLSGLPENTVPDTATEALIRQICSLEWDIEKDRAAHKQVDKSLGALNTLIGSLGLKPAQKKDDTDSSIDKTPLGVWAQRLEHKRPIKEVDPELQDVDGIIRYISIWFLGHLCKMLGIKNSYCKLYEEEIAKMRIDHPEYDDEDDETLFNDIFASDEQNDK